MLALDPGVFHGKAKEIGIREALLWSGIGVAVAIFFNIFYFVSMGSETVTEFDAGYIVERTLSLDNLFVFLLIFSNFRVPAKIHGIIYIFGHF